MALSATAQLWERSLRAALLAWYRSPSAQNEAAVNREKQWNRLERRSMAAVLAFLTVLAAGSGHEVICRLIEGPARELR